MRLKGGCATVFGRVSSELRALEAAGARWEVVPGVSSVLAAPALAGFPLTDAAVGRSFAVVSGHDVAATDWGALAAGADALVVLMGGAALPEIAERLLAAGRAPATPVAVVRAAGTPEQRVWRSSLGSVAADTAGEALSPCVVVVGAVAGLTFGGFDTAGGGAAAGATGDGQRQQDGRLQGGGGGE